MISKTLSECTESIRSQMKASGLWFEKGPDRDLRHAVCGLVEEAGEVAGLVKRQSYRGKEQPRTRWLEELGDVLWYLIATAVSLDVSLDEVFEYNERKLRERHGEKGFKS